MQATFQERAIGAAGATIVLISLGWILFAGLRGEVGDRAEEVIRLLDLSAPSKHRPVPPPAHRPASRPSGTPSPRNLRNQAAEVVVPPMVAPAPSPIATAPLAGAGMAAETGASVLPGPGEGAGGTGDGRGGGGHGDGGDDSPPRQIRGRLQFSDVPAALRDAKIGGTVAVRYRVGTDGHVRDCVVSSPSGNAELDGLTCRLIERRFRFEPSRDRQGRPVGSIIEESHRWIYDREDSDDPHK